MEKIDSFKVDHTRLLRGIYTSRKDHLKNGDIVTTFDIRMKEPNREPAIGQAAIHTIEHLGATFLRNHQEWGNHVIYFGPMGCCTGFYLLLEGDLEPRDIIDLTKEMFAFITTYDGEIPGASAHDCGNYMLNNLPMANWETRKFLVEILEHISDENMIYPA